MSETPEPKTPITNRILAALPAKEYQRLLPKLDQFSLTFGEKIYEPGGIIRDVYFPESGIISLLARVEDHRTFEVGIVGKEGMVGLPPFLGVKTSNNRAVVQGTGTALKMKTADFLAECQPGGSLPRLLNRFLHSLLTQITQSAVCFRFHPIEERLARWLLMTSDRMASDNFQLTQDFLTNMLGVRREAVNKAAVILQHRQLINYRRGNISILDRAALETSACNCYGIIKKEENS